ncbi:CRAL/TRIO domain-containing protein [Phthorimaea operculella]|nr:CRAL/TRIO domain-containing protein [Phthorimaea operculella]
MESLPNNAFLEYNKDTLEAVRKHYNLEKPGVMKEAVDILEEWVKKQHHFKKKTFDRRYLETTIIISKGSIETAKAKLDKACTIRTLMPHIFQVHDIRNDIASELGDLNLGILPKLTKGHERVFIYKNSGQKFGPNVVPYIIRNTAAISEYLRRNDYSVSFIGVADYLDVNLGAVIGHVGLRDLQEFVAVAMHASGFRLKAAYFISSSKLIEVMVALFKQILSPKLGARLHVLKDRESLKNVIDSNILPKEYGGTEKSLKEMQGLVRCSDLRRPPSLLTRDLLGLY